MGAICLRVAINFINKVSAMSKKDNVVNTEPVERRKHWRDRRKEGDRRNPERLRLLTYDCRTRQLRRESDMGGELSDGEVWWNKGASK